MIVFFLTWWWNQCAYIIDDHVAHRWKLWPMILLSFHFIMAKLKKKKKKKIPPFGILLQSFWVRKVRRKKSRSPFLSVSIIMSFSLSISLSVYTSWFRTLTHTTHHLFHYIIPCLASSCHISTPLIVSLSLSILRISHSISLSLPGDSSERARHIGHIDQARSSFQQAHFSSKFYWKSVVSQEIRAPVQRPRTLNK